MFVSRMMKCLIPVWREHSSCLNMWKLAAADIAGLTCCLRIVKIHWILLHYLNGPLLCCWYWCGHLLQITRYVFEALENLASCKLSCLYVLMTGLGLVTSWCWSLWTVVFIHRGWSLITWMLQNFRWSRFSGWVSYQLLTDAMLLPVRVAILCS